MTAEQANDHAKELARTRGWTFLDPVRVEPCRFWSVGRLRWRVISNCDNRGCNVRVEIDDATGEVLKENFIPR
jgi:hypothetical protein